MSSNWGGARSGAGRPDSGLDERITMEVTPLMKRKIEREAEKRHISRGEYVRFLLGKALDIAEPMTYAEGRYRGVTAEGRIVVVDADEFSEVLAEAKRDGADERELYSAATWENLIPDNSSVWYETLEQTQPQTQKKTGIEASSVREYNRLYGRKRRHPEE